MLDKLKANKSKILAHSISGLGGIVLVAIVGTATGETLGLSTLAAGLFGLFGQGLCAGLLEKRLGK